MKGLVACNWMEINFETLTTPREGRVIGSLEINIHQRQYRPQKSLRLTKWQLEDKP